jgi:hypothetical protein
LERSLFKGGGESLSDASESIHQANEGQRHWNRKEKSIREVVNDFLRD